MGACDFDVALPAERTAVFGVSASAELALAMGLRHPEIYRPMRVTRWRLPTARGDAERASARVPRAGKQEPFFLANATRWADALRAALAGSCLGQRAGSHGGAFGEQSSR